MVTVVGGIIISTADLIITVANNANFSVMIIFCIFAFVGILASCQLPETFEQPSIDIIEEIAQKIHEEN